MRIGKSSKTTYFFLCIMNLTEGSEANDIGSMLSQVSAGFNKSELSHQCKFISNCLVTITEMLFSTEWYRLI